MYNALTIDVEDYYHVSAFESIVSSSDWDDFPHRVEANTFRILDLLDQHHAKATFFVLGWVAKRQPHLVLEIQRRGHEIGSHGFSHRRIYTQTREQFRYETRLSKDILEDIIGQKVIGYRAASYSITIQSLWALDILIEQNFLYDSSIFPIWHDLYGIPEAKRFFHSIQRDAGTIYEFPLSTVKVWNKNIPFGGGGYLRLFPYFFTKWGIRKMNQQENHPAIVYLHPWEVDPEQPRLPGKLTSRFRHYTNLHKTISILQRLLADFTFVPMRELFQARQSQQATGVASSSMPPTGEKMR